MIVIGRLFLLLLENQTGQSYQKFLFDERLNQKYN